MLMNDPLGDMLTRIRNAQLRKRPTVRHAGLDASRAACSMCCRRRATSAAIPRSR